MSSETKLTMLEMKLSLIITCLIFFQSLVSSPSRRQIDSRASLTAAGGLAIARTSTRCCFLIELTAREGMEVWAPRVDRWNYRQKSRLCSLLERRRSVCCHYKERETSDVDLNTADRNPATP
uniref:Uncharacterized protein n=1 Tax=Cyprinus carpio carpio TaxID=630221 RepID=A0A8C1H4W5_CYPCA